MRVFCSIPMIFLILTVSCSFWRFDVPAGVSDLVAEPGDGFVTLRWTEPVDLAMVGVEIAVNMLADRPIRVRAGIGECLLEGLTNYQEYSFEVSAMNSFGGLSDAATVTAIPRVRGAVDASFGTGGLTRVDVPSVRTYACAAAFAPDGDLVVAGGSGQHSYFTRFNADGTLDASFGVGGIANFALADFMDYIIDVAVQPDGKIVGTGVFYMEIDGYDSFVLRLNADGSRDASFGNNGFARFITEDVQDFGSALMLQPDGKLVVVGASRTIPGGEYDLFLVRFLPTGSYEENFGGFTSHVVIDCNGAGDNTVGAYLQPDGRIVAAGYSDLGSGTPFLRRFLADGTVDSSFGSAGLIGGTDLPEMPLRIVRLGAGDRIYYGADDGWGTFSIVSLFADGTLDAGFHHDGIYTPERKGEVADLRVLPRGELLVACNDDTGGNPQGVLLLLHPDGTPVAGFGSGGFQVHDPGITIIEEIGRVLPAPDDRLVVVGFALEGSVRNLFVSRIWY